MIGASPILWPDGYRSAASFTFDVDAESAVLWRAPQNASRMSIISHQAYGPLVGVPRLLGMLDQRGIRSTFFVPGYTAMRYPEMVRDIVGAGHEIGHHGYLHEQPSALSRADQADALDRGLDAIDRAAGVRPIGYRAPMWDLAWETPELLFDRGFLYDSSLMDSDHPYELALASGSDRSIVELPIEWTLDDWEQYCYLPDISGTGLIETPSKARELWASAFRGLHSAGGLWILTNHPFLSGRPGRALELGALMDEVTQTPGVWVAPLQEIAEHVRTLQLPPRSISRPQDLGSD